MALMKYLPNVSLALLLTGASLQAENFTNVGVINSLSVGNAITCTNGDIAAPSGIIFAGNYLQSSGKVYAGSDFVTPYSLYAGAVALSGNAGLFGSGTYNNSTLAPTLDFGNANLKSVFIWHPGKAAMMVGTLNGAYQDYQVGSASYSFGKELKTQSAGVFVVGQFNSPEGSSTVSVNANSPMFVVGNGDSDTSRSNAFVVYKNGTVSMNAVSYSSGSVSSLSANYLTGLTANFSGSLKVGAGSSNEKFAVLGGNIYGDKHLVMGTSVPSRYDVATGYNSIWAGNSNSGLIGETSSGFKGAYLSANTVRSQTLGWAHQDTTQPAWLVGANYENQYTDRFAVLRSSPTSGTASFQSLLTVLGSGNLGVGTGTPTERVSVLSGDNNLPTNIMSVRAQNGTQGVGISYSGIRKLTNLGANDLYVDGASTGNVILNSNGGTGNVGVGTNSPQAKLDVNGNLRVAGSIIMTQPQGDISMGVFQ